ncbi:hypothetical protein LTR86_006309 [Recurvomyces mirabilis]|nr:hypothetical protein LTR86_006309 [Recurvomyces mirabilis]
MDPVSILSLVGVCWTIAARAASIGTDIKTVKKLFKEGYNTTQEIDQLDAQSSNPHHRRSLSYEQRLADSRLYQKRNGTTPIELKVEKRTQALEQTVARLRKQRDAANTQAQLADTARTKRDREVTTLEQDLDLCRKRIAVATERARSKAGERISGLQQEMAGCKEEIAAAHQQIRRASRHRDQDSQIIGMLRDQHADDRLLLGARERDRRLLGDALPALEKYMDKWIDNVLLLT